MGVIHEMPSHRLVSWSAVGRNLPVILEALMFACVGMVGRVAVSCQLHGEVFVILDFDQQSTWFCLWVLVTWMYTGKE